MNAPALTRRDDPARFDVLEEHIKECRATLGRIDVPHLLAKGWRLADLLASDDFGVVIAAREYELKAAGSEQAAIVALVLTMAGASLILAYGFAAPVLRGVL